MKTRVMLPQGREHLGYQRLKEARKDPYSAGFRGNMAMLTPCFQTCSPYNCNTVYFYCSKPLSLWYFVMETLENYYTIY